MNIRHAAAAAALCAAALAQPLGANAADEIDDFNPVTTGVASLGICPDARGAAMGELGAATEADANSQYWNPSKYAFAYSKGAIVLNYTPWLRKIVNDIFLADVSGYWKLGASDMQALSASLRYFSLGEVIATGTTINPYELAVDLGYSRKLSTKFSMGIVMRYIYSAMGFDQSETNPVNTGASAFSADISGYFTTYPIIGRNECQWSWGWNISNIGTKLKYKNTDPAFLPTNLRLGTAFTFPIADYHNLTFGLDLNKLLVPVKPRLQDYETQADYQRAEEEWRDMSPITGIFKSFSDAPGGFSEELREIAVSFGAEYVYNEQFFLRAGYHYENPQKGNRQYFNVGAGFALNVLRLDAAYTIATAANSPLDQTLRFSLTFDMEGVKNLFSKK